MTRSLSFIVAVLAFAAAALGTARAEDATLDVRSDSTWQTSAPPSTASVWPRLVAGMRLGGEQRPEVRRFIAHYAANPAYLSAMLARAEPFLWYVLHATEARQLPTELALLPAVESGWNPKAVSVSAAHGLWQFIPKTGDAYGLRNALNYEARRDPVASTDAALGLLAELHGEYDDWSLALAAYNTGGVRLKQVMKRSRSRDFWRLPLPQVTRDYVPRLLALAALVRQPARYGVTLPHIAESGVAEIIALDQSVPLHLALTAAGVDTDVLRTFNPALTRHGEATHSPTLLLPPADAIALRAELAVLQQGIVPTSRLASPGTKLRLQHGSEPVDDESQPTEVTAQRLAERMHWAGQISSPPATAVDALPGNHYRVRAGDTLFTIAQRSRQTVSALRRINGLSSGSALKPGQLLKLNACAGNGCG